MSNLLAFLGLVVVVLVIAYVVRRSNKTPVVVAPIAPATRPVAAVPAPTPTGVVAKKVVKKAAVKKAVK